MPEGPAPAGDSTAANAARSWLTARDAGYQECGLTEIDVATDIMNIYPVRKPAFDVGTNATLPYCAGKDAATNLFEYNPCKNCNMSCLPDYAVRWLYVTGGSVTAVYEQNKPADQFALLECS